MDEWLIRRMFVAHCVLAHDPFRIEINVFGLIKCYLHWDNGWEYSWFGLNSAISKHHRI